MWTKVQVSVIKNNLVSLEMPKSLAKVIEITGKPINFYEIDISDKNGLRRVFSQNKIDCVIHIAALKSVSESFQSPIKYYSGTFINYVSI